MREMLASVAPRAFRQSETRDAESGLATIFIGLMLFVILGFAALAKGAGLAAGVALGGAIGISAATFFAMRGLWSLRSRWWEREFERKMERITSSIRETAKALPPPAPEGGP